MNKTNYHKAVFLITMDRQQKVVLNPIHYCHQYRLLNISALVVRSLLDKLNENLKYFEKARSKIRN